jgi:hypothetical protein
VLALFFCCVEENRNKFTWVARQAANICLWVPAAAFGVDRIAVMGFNLIGSPLSAAARQLLINRKNEPTTN